MTMGECRLTALKDQRAIQHLNYQSRKQNSEKDICWVSVIGQWFSRILSLSFTVVNASEYFSLHELYDRAGYQMVQLLAYREKFIMQIFVDLPGKCYKIILFRLLNSFFRKN
jgi:hypothetical protein